MPATPSIKPPVAYLSFARQVHILILYARALLIEFRWTILLLAILVIIGAFINAITNQDLLHGQPPSLGLSIFSAWMALLAQPQYPQPQPVYLLLVYALYPMFGIVLIVEGIIRLAMLMVSHRLGEKKWMMVMASTYRNHVILCGLGISMIEMETEFAVRVLTHSNGGNQLTAPSPVKTKLAGGDKLVVHASAKEFPKFAAPARPA